jgi:glycerol uptake facilitator-like aquaporin
MFGILITFMISKVEYNGEKKTITPSVPTLCPALGCNTEYLHWQTFLIEVLASFALVFSFLIIRFSNFDGVSKRWMSFVGPVSITIIYKGCIQFGSQTARGLLNPTLAFQLLFWSMGAYNQKDKPEEYPDKSKFDYDNYGRYAWCYIVAPLVASVVAGILARKHLLAQSQEEENKEVV